MSDTSTPNPQGRNNMALYAGLGVAGLGVAIAAWMVMGNAASATSCPAQIAAAEIVDAAAVGELAASSVNFVVRPWVKAEDYWAVRFALNEKIKLAFDSNQITIPFPQMNINVQK